MWVIWFGRFGFVGLGSWILAMAIPPWRLLRAFPAAAWLHPRVAAAVALSVVLGIYQIDCLFNGFPQPVFVLAAGAILSLTVVRSAAPIASKTTRRELQATAIVPGKAVVIANRGF